MNQREAFEREWEKAQKPDIGWSESAWLLWQAALSSQPKPDLLDPDMPEQQLRLHCGELTADEVRTARAVIRWANSRIKQE